MPHISITALPETPNPSERQLVPAFEVVDNDTVRIIMLGDDGVLRGATIDLALLN